ncbi:unnamed protein product [Meloidogyne enterolobii]|uniref:Uncharacterized protein n=1 Tax=Meloidogyne enterolobii TaxID=390850 RepID=A0ACB0Y6D9_MELEN
MFSCSLAGIPDTQELWDKCRLPLGLHIQPFRDMKGLKVIHTVITRCRYCRTYINPYVFIMDSRHWKCNLCYRANDLPEEFLWDPQTKSFGDPGRRPELQETTIEYIAPTEYMLREPQPPVYFFLLDVSSNAVDCGYLHIFAEQLAIDIDRFPGNENALIGFMGFDSALHFFQFEDSTSEPKHIIEFDIDESFPPVCSGLVVPLEEFKLSIKKFISKLPGIFDHGVSSSNCLGSALAVTKELIEEIGGRVTIMLSSLPNIGLGALKLRDDSKVSKLKFTPQVDYYRTFALECTGKQIAIDLFAIGERNVDLPTLADISRFSSGTVYHFPKFHFVRGQAEIKRLQMTLHRYFTRKLGLEAVLRIRCSKGVSLHSFYGNFFVRSTDLLSLPNVSPDSALGVQIKLDETLTSSHVCFQAALLYTSTKGDRRIRVHTLSLPVLTNTTHVYSAVDINTTISLLSKMATERALSGSDLSDCREALINAVVDALAGYQRILGQTSSTLRMPAEGGLQYMPIYVLGLLKHRAFSGAQKASMDERMASLLMFKTVGIEVLLMEVCPALYSVHNFVEQPVIENDHAQIYPERLPPRFELKEYFNYFYFSYEQISNGGIYLLDVGTSVYLYVCSGANPKTISGLFGVNCFEKLDEDIELEEETSQGKQITAFLQHLQDQRWNVYAPIIVIRNDSPHRELFASRLIQDRTDSSHSYAEFMQHIQREVNLACK